MFTSVDRLFDSRSDFVPNLYDLSLYIVLSSFTHRRLTAQLFFWNWISPRCNTWDQTPHLGQKPSLPTHPEPLRP